MRQKTVGDYLDAMQAAEETARRHGTHYVNVDPPRDRLDSLLWIGVGVAAAASASAWVYFFYLCR